MALGRTTSAETGRTAAARRTRRPRSQRGAASPLRDRSVSLAQRHCRSRAAAEASVGTRFQGARPGNNHRKPRKEVPMATATEQIRTEEPVRNTFHNLVQTLNVKLDSAARYGLYQEDARNDGFDDCAELFGKLKQSEQQEIQGLVRCLQQHIGDSGAGG